MKFYLAFFLLTLALPAAAEYTVGKDKCAGLARHVPAADVEYKEGEDAQGWAVAPADLASNPWQESLTKDLPAAELRLPLEPYVNKDSYNVDLSQTELNLGMLKTEDATVTLNNERLEQAPDVYYDPECLEGQKER